jgi:hypothetical protein
MLKIPHDDIMLETQLLHDFAEECTPVFQLKMGSMQLFVYKAKDIDSPQWNNLFARRIVVEARKRFREFYGNDIPLEDVYDQKSSVFFSHISYTVSSYKIHEWFSARFIPFVGIPYGNEDINFYIHKIDNRQYPLIDVLSSYTPLITIEDVFAFSRFCSIHPYSIDDNNFVMHQNKNKYTSLAFITLYKCFFDDMQKNKRKVSLLSCQMHESLIGRIEDYLQENIKNIRFTTATEFLNVSKKSIFLHRQHPDVYAYQYPGYFLHLNDLVKLLDKNIKKGTLTKASIESYLDTQLTWEDVFISPTKINIKGLGKLLTTQGNISAKLTGMALRKMVDTYVKDGVSLYLLDGNQWQHHVNDMVVYMQAQHT